MRSLLGGLLALVWAAGLTVYGCWYALSLSNPGFDKLAFSTPLVTMLLSLLVGARAWVFGRTSLVALTVAAIGPPLNLFVLYIQGLGYIP